MVRDGDIKIIPARFEKTYFAWIDHLRDWCVSRQIWWGHRIPVWYKPRSSQKRLAGRSSNEGGREELSGIPSSKGVDIHVGMKAPRGKGWEQDSDTLDTWFSSALWSWSTLIDPKLTEDGSLSLQDLLDQSPDFKKFHPNSVMETGYDIIFFWVARMILMTTYITKQVPFHTVYLHGLVRDMQGRKMSKSLGNGIDPVEMVEKYGADAVRLSLVIGTTPGNDTKLNEQKIENYRNFVNKLWNIARFILTTVKEPRLVEEAPKPVSLSDRLILSRFQRLIEQTTKHVDCFEFSAAGEALYAFTWNELADWYVEDAKVEADKDEVLLYILTNLIKLWQPFTPFVAQVLWQELSKDKDYVMVAAWPKAKTDLIDEAAEKHYALYQDAVTQIRNFRAEFNVPYTKSFLVTVITEQVEAVESLRAAITRKTKIEAMVVTAADRAAQQEATCYFSGGKVYIPMAGLVDVEKERARLQKELTSVRTYILGLGKKLSNKEFVKNAPEAVVAAEQQKQAEGEAKMKSIESQLSMLA